MADYQTIRAGAGVRTAAIDEGLRAHMNKVYGMMSVGMVVTFAVAWSLSGLAVSEVPNAYQIGEGRYLTDLGVALYASPLRWVLMFAPLIFVFGFSAMINRMSAATAQTVFYVFGATFGASLSSIFLVYTSFSIAQVFLITAIAFASLSLWGYTTKKDISGWGSFLIMGVVGLIVASLVNIFFFGGAFSQPISFIGVLIFAGLTAYDTQSIKNEYVAHAAQGDQEWLGKAAVMGSLRLYLDFINMFMFLLQLLGNRE